MTRAIRIHANGGPQVMRWEEVDLPPPAAGEARVRHTAIGINFSDLNVRRGGFYIAKPVQFPLIIGNEAAGVVESVAPGVTAVKPGDRVVYAGMSAEFFENTGSYAQARNVPVERLLAIPDDVTDRQAAATMVKGFTASLIINRVYKPKPGDVILVHAAASGVGLILCQWSKHLGATVIGTVGTPDKAVMARAHGCDHEILYRDHDFVAAVKKIVPQGVSAVFDGVGKDTFERSIPCVKRFGTLVNYGNASGHVPPLDLLLLARHGSLSVSRPGFSHYVAECGGLAAASAELFQLVGDGVLRVCIGRSYALRNAVSAHRDHEARAFSGSAVLIP